MTQKVGVLIGEGFNGKEVKETLDTLKENGVMVEIIAEKLGSVTGEDGTVLEPTKTFLTVHPSLFDAIYIAGGKSQNQLKFDQIIFDFVRMQYMHLKPIGVSSGKDSYIAQTEHNNGIGVVSATDNPDFANQFVAAIAQKRFWDRT